eukprot:6213940-Pleurochrysis_carterae.AAC.1
MMGRGLIVSMCYPKTATKECVFCDTPRPYALLRIVAVPVMRSRMAHIVLRDRFCAGSRSRAPRTPLAMSWPGAAQPIETPSHHPREGAKAEGHWF